MPKVIHRRQGGLSDHRSTISSGSFIRSAQRRRGPAGADSDRAQRVLANTTDSLEGERPRAVGGWSHSGSIGLVAATHQEEYRLSEEPPLRRTVRDFIKYYGLSRNGYLAARRRANVRARDWGTLLSANDEKALLQHIIVEKRSEQVVRRIREQPTVTRQFAPPPKPPVDYDAEIERMSASLDKWRKVLVELAQLHVAEDSSGRCKRCHEEAPCRTRQTLNRLDNELVEQVAVADSGDLAEGCAADQSMPDLEPERTLSQLYDARDRWRRALTELTMDHMIEDGQGRCAQCPVGTPCDIGKVVTRINRGIARQIEKYACMDDGEREVALGNRRITRYYQDDDWDAM